MVGFSFMLLLVPCSKCVGGKNETMSSFHGLKLLVLLDMLHMSWVDTFAQYESFKTSKLV